MKRSYTKQIRSAPRRPVIYAAGHENNVAPHLGWVTWDGAESDLHLSGDSVVRLRQGDQILAQRTERGLDIHAYRPRVEH